MWRDDVGVLDGAFAAAGGVFRGSEQIVRADRQTVAAAFDEFRRRSPSWTWRVSDADLERAVELGTAWTLDRYGTLDVQLQDESSVRWRIYDVDR
jgi:hypothetical protein